jgi:hypothetical protein
MLVGNTLIDPSVFGSMPRIICAANCDSPEGGSVMTKAWLMMNGATPRT